MATQARRRRRLSSDTIRRACQDVLRYVAPNTCTHAVRLRFGGCMRVVDRIGRLQHWFFSVQIGETDGYWRLSHRYDCPSTTILSNVGHGSEVLSKLGMIQVHDGPAKRAAQQPRRPCRASRPGRHRCRLVIDDTNEIEAKGFGYSGIQVPVFGWGALVFHGCHASLSFVF